MLRALREVPGVRADFYDAMRVNWFNHLTGGTAYDPTDPDAVSATNHFTPSPTTAATSGANCAWCTSIVRLRGVIVNSSANIATASVTSPDGFYIDGSYIGRCSLSYNGGYGL